MSSGLHLRSVNPFLIVYMLANIRELTLSGNFGSTELSECVADTSSQSRTLMPQHVPNLVSIRLIDIDEAEFLAVFLVGIAHRIASLVIQPSEKGRTQPYYPPSVYTTLSPIIEKLSSLSSLTISLPSSKLRLIRFNRCRFARKVVSESLVPLPSKDKLKLLSIDLRFILQKRTWNIL